ncbi:MAG TPA: DUF3822 family protein, partial [Chitinophagaceae bacterium]|nr:DUF3822 family protein [Chitinophagaceae bacterium]
IRGKKITKNNFKYQTRLYSVVNLGFVFYLEFICDLELVIWNFTLTLPQLNELLKPSFHIKPGVEHNPANSILLMIAGARHCSFAVMNYLSKELVEFGYYTTTSDEADYSDFFDRNRFLNNRYHQTAIAFVANECVQIPSVVYKYEDAQLHLDANYGKDVHVTIVSENLPALNLYNVYRIPSNLHATISRKFLSGKFWHLYTVVLKNIPAQLTDPMFIDFKTDEFSVIILRQSKLLLCQTFMYTTPDDVLYYLLKCCQHLNLSQRQTKVFLSGLIEKDSVLYRELYKYFIHLEFESLPNDIKLAEELSAHPQHYYSSISKLAACVL